MIYGDLFCVIKLYRDNLDCGSIIILVFALDSENLRRWES